MKELKNIFDNYHKKLKISFNLFYNQENVILGEILSKSGNTIFNFIYKNSPCQCIIQGQGARIDDLVEILKATFDYSDSQTIKNKQDYLVKVLLGITGTEELNKKFNINYTSCVVLVVNSKGKSSEIADFLSLYTICLPVIINNDITACILSANAEKQDYLSLSKFANVLCLAIEEELGVMVKVGLGSTVDSFNKINQSYTQAELAIKQGDKSKKVFTYLEILPKKMLSSITLQESVVFLAPFKGLLSDKELLLTAKEFLNGNLNINKTAQNLFIHRNTLTYRLNKIEKLYGFDLKNFNDAVVFRLICLLGEKSEK